MALTLLYAGSGIGAWEAEDEAEDEAEAETWGLWFWSWGSGCCFGGAAASAQLRWASNSHLLQR